jgi:hypothetical protein
MKLFAIVLLSNKKEIYDKYWVKCYNQEDVDIALRCFNDIDYYREIIYLPK